MPYVVKYDDITNLWFAANGKFGEWNETLQGVTESLNQFVEMESFQGQTAQSVKAYISEVHFSVLISIGEILSEYQARYLLYKDGYCQQVDNHLHANLQEETLGGLREFFRQSYLDFDAERNNVRSIASSISDLVSASFPHESAVDTDYMVARERVKTLEENTGEYENARYGSDFTHLDRMLAALKSFIEQQLGQDKKYVVSYMPGTVQNTPGFGALVDAVNNAGTDRAALQDALAAAAANEEVRFAQLEEEWAQQREEQGWLELAIGALVVVGGVVCIVATAGLATPLVVAGAVAGTATVAYGASNMVQSGQDIYYGMNGDYSTAAWNPLRDTVFGGNQQAYDIFGTVCLISSSVLSLGAGAISAGSAAVNAGTSVGRALAVYGGKVVIGAGSGMIGGWAGQQVALNLGASETIANLVGLLSGTAVGAVAGFGLQKIDQNFNLSGFYRTQPSVSPQNIEGVDEGSPLEGVNPNHSQQGGPIDQAASGDLNLMDNSDEFYMYASNRSDIDPNGCLDVVAHGTPDKIEMTINGQKVLVDHRTAANYIMRSPDFNGQDIRLLSCSTGASDSGFAQNLANRLNVTVTAPEDVLWSYPNGRMIVAPRLNGGNVPDLNNLGGFRTFKPGGY